MVLWVLVFSFSWAKDDLSTTLKKLDQANSILRKGIKALYLMKQDRTPRDDPKAAFDLYLRERLALVSKQDVKEVRFILDKRLKILTSFRDGDQVIEDYGSISQDGSNTITIAFPKPLQNGWAFYLTLTHEIEHVLQNLELKRQGLDRINLGSLPYQPGHKSQLSLFLKESGAILAEKTYIQKMSENAKKEAIAQLKQYHSKKGADQKFSINALGHAHVEANDYLKYFWKQGRYDLKTTCTFNARKIPEEDYLPSIERLIQKQFCDELLGAEYKSRHRPKTVLEN